MNNKYLLIVFFVIHSAVVAAEEMKADLTVILSGFPSNVGKAMVALVNSEESFKARKGEQVPYRSIALKINQLETRTVFNAIPYGHYAVKVFHDENDNDDLDTNFLGIPSESYGFSNNAHGTFGPPDYEDAIFSFNPEQTSITILIE